MPQLVASLPPYTILVMEKAVIGIGAENQIISFILFYFTVIRNYCSAGEESVKAKPLLKGPGVFSSYNPVTLLTPAA